MDYAGIFEVYCLPVGELMLPPLQDLDGAGDGLVISADWSQIEITGNATVSEETAEENGQTVYSVQLSFFCARRAALPERYCVFRIRDVNGRNSLIGTGERPYPVVTYKYTDSGPTGKKGYEYTVKYRNSVGLIPLSA